MRSKRRALGLATREPVQMWNHRGRGYIGILTLFKRSSPLPINMSSRAQYGERRSTRSKTSHASEGFPSFYGCVFVRLTLLTHLEYDRQPHPDRHFAIVVQSGSEGELHHRF